MNGNGKIDKSEAVQAVIAYFDGTITRQEAINNVVAYFSESLPIPIITSTPTPIPSPSPTPSPTPSPSPSPTTFPTPAITPAILSNSNYTDTLGYYTVVGEVQNNLNSNIQFVKITAAFYDANNTVIGTDFTFTDINILKPNQKSPFELSTFPDKINPTKYKLSLAYSITNIQPFAGLQILSNSSQIDQLGYFKIVGEVKNNGLNSSTFVKVVATYYNSSNIVIGKSFTFTDPSMIQINDTAPFELSSFPLKIIPTKYELQVEGS
ncbi:MAG: FxLYD domain-containing protein (plasmid) [Candidatus Methanoperedens sp.]|nr:MAG: FxLYD domain-containing protein [Candidatus Methanoperedens sp.]